MRAPAPVAEAPGAGRLSPAAGHTSHAWGIAMYMEDKFGAWQDDETT